LNFAPPPPWLWIVFTLFAAAGQVLRNAMQRSLTERLGTTGATHVRFLYGLPFGLLFFAFAFYLMGQPMPKAQPGFWPWIILGACTQIVATALMLTAMRSKSFVMTTAYVKTEPVQVAIFAAVFLGDRLPAWIWISVIVATVGVVMMSWQKSVAPTVVAKSNEAETSDFGAALAGPPSFANRLGAGMRAPGSGQAMAFGLGAAAFFALAAVGFRGGVIHLGDSHFFLRASLTLAIGLTIQTFILSTYLLIRDRQVMVKLAELWRPSMLGGFLGAFSSQMWYLAFALSTVAQVRTLALVEIFFALIVSKKLFAQGTSRREMFGMVLIALGVAGVALLS
jgi:drug/metabolite transporter (DMT)-like permease